MTVSVEQAKLELEKLLVRLSQGEELVLTQGGREVARIVPAEQSTGKSVEPDGGAWKGRTGWGAGMVLWVAPDFDAPLDDFKEYME